MMSTLISQEHNDTNRSMAQNQINTANDTRINHEESTMFGDPINMTIENQFN